MPFAVEEIWRGGSAVRVADPHSTLGLIAAGVVARVAVPGRPCCLCARRVSRPGLIETITLAVSHDAGRGHYRAVARAYCARCAPQDPDALDDVAGIERGAVLLRFRAVVPPSTAAKPGKRAVTG